MGHTQENDTSQTCDSDAQRTKSKRHKLQVSAADPELYHLVPELDISVSVHITLQITSERHNLSLERPLAQASILSLLRSNNEQ
jgi:hypothetical protein